MEKQIRYKGIDLFYSDSGVGPCMVLIHGYLENGRIWQPFMDMFPEGFRFVVPDLPGHGSSESWGKIHSMDELAEAVRTILDEEGIPRAFVAGHSMGGYVTMAFAQLYSDRLSAYALLHSTPFADTEEKRENRDREISLVLCGKKRQIVMVNIPKAFASENLDRLSGEVDRLKQMALHCPDLGIIALLNGMKERPDRTAVLQNLPLPLLLIGGMKDNYIPAELFEKLVSLAPHARVLRLEESGHLGFLEEPGPVVRAFLEILETITLKPGQK
ncbi:MAG: alpha/beta hydrolase [Bacteroidales bacterium]|nr:alpha/beta hydrolase [Bacteroidales bacterium]